MEESQSSGNNLLEHDLLDLVKLLRREANDLKECFTRYSLQGIALSIAILGIILRFIWETPETGLASIASLVIVLTASRLGTFKYQAANRYLGYELHLFRTRNLREGKRWRPEMRWIGWEEAMRSWRIVQATLFEAIYTSSSVAINFPSPNLGINVRRGKFRKKDGKYWFSQKSLMGETDTRKYYPGSYLKTMMSLLHLLAAISVCVMILSLILLWRKVSNASETELLFQYKEILQPAIIIFVAIVVLLTVLKIVKSSFRRRIIEDGLLSIHSCAITWQAVIIAHFEAKAATETAKDARLTNTGYTEMLAELAEDLAHHADDIYGWIDGKYSGDLDTRPIAARGSSIKLINPASEDIKRSSSRILRFLLKVKGRKE